MTMHDCKQEENIGKFKEFMLSMNGFKTTLVTMAIAIALQVGTFLYLWGSLTATVNQNTKHLWMEITPLLMENTRNIDKILGKFELLTVIQGSQGVSGVQGIQGLQGNQGKQGEKGE